MFTIEVNKVDFLTIVFSFDEEGIEEFSCHVDFLKNHIDHSFFVIGAELDDVNNSGDCYYNCDFLNVIHLPENLTQCDIRIDNYKKDKKGSAIEIFCNNRGIDKLLDGVNLLSSENRSMELVAPCSSIISDDNDVKNDCVILIKMQLI